MTELVRLSISLESTLNDRLDGLIAESGAANRSEFIRDLIRQRLVSREWERDEVALGTLTLVYDHTRRRLSEKLVEVQHGHHDCVLASTHVHLDEHLCAEMIMMRGPAQELRHMVDTIAQQKGVLHAELSMSSTGKKLI